MKLRHKRIILFPLAIFLLANAAFAADPSGTWQWTTTNRTGQETKFTAQIQLKSGSLAGTVTTPKGDRRIDGGTFMGNSVSFSVALSSVTTAKYSGTLYGDTITGSIVLSGSHGTVTRDWSARRDTYTSPPSAPPNRA